MRNILAGIGAVVVAGIAIAAASSHNTGSPAAASSSAAAAASANAASALASAQSAVASIPSSTPTPQAPTKVEFIVSGSAPDGIDITYGPAGSDFSGPSVLDGTATMSVKFDPNAEYYAMDAQLQGDGSITCKIVVTGPGDAPLTVSHGAASGGYNICSAQAAPENNGLQWQDEQ